MKRVVVLLVTLTLIAGAVGCPADPGLLPDPDPDPSPPAEYGLTLSSSLGGQVTTPGEGTFAYEEGSTISLVAQAEEGYRFVNWTGDVATVADAGAARTTITMNGDYSVTADFVAVCLLTVVSTEGGSVTVPGEGTFTYDIGTVVGLAAVPNPGHRFLNWAGDIDSIGDPNSAQTTIAMNDNHSISVDFEAGYAIHDTLLEGLSTPYIHARDELGRVYFTQFDPLADACRINRLDPVTGESVQFVEHQDARVRALSLDGQGNIYYVLKLFAEPPMAQIRKLQTGAMMSQVLFSIVESDRWIRTLAVDWSGNVYFVLQSGEEHQYLPGSELRRITAGTTMTETLLVLEDSLEMSNVSVDDDRSVLFFTSNTQEASRIYGFDLESETAVTVLEKTAENLGRIAYLATRANGELYYLYRQRSELDDTVQFGYLEIGRFAPQALEIHQSPEILVADDLDQGVIVWRTTTPSCFAVSDIGDVFFDIGLYQHGPLEQTQVGVFWFDPLTGAYVALVEGTIEEVYALTFALDNEGNLYYAASNLDTIVRISR